MTAVSAGAGTSARDLINAAKVVLWDFDGVIKESLDVKGSAFERLFGAYGSEAAAKVRRHHDENGGLSRFAKIPLYLEWAGEPATEDRVNEYCERFSRLVLDAVVDCDWVPGVRDYLADNYHRQRFALITATPTGEIRRILEILAITHFFEAIHGAPTPKGTAVRESLLAFRAQATDSVMVGDSRSDFEAARENAVPFVLRRTPYNGDLARVVTGPSFIELAP